MIECLRSAFGRVGSSFGRTLSQLENGCTPAKFWSGLFIVYALLVGAYLAPLWLSGTPHYVGIDSNDLFNEIILTWDVGRHLLAGQLPCFSDMLGFPNAYSLLGGFKSFLHTLVALPFLALLPWPHWWNATNAAALIINALLTSFALYYVSKDRLGSALLGSLTIFSVWNNYSAMEGHLAQMWYGPLLLAVALLYERLLVTAQEPQKVWPWGWQSWVLGISVLSAALIYWPNGAFLLLAAVIFLVAGRFRLASARWKQMILLAVGILCLAAPLARMVCDYSEDIIDLGLFNSEAENEYGRSFHNSLGFPRHTSDICLPLPAVTPTVVAGIILALLFWWCVKEPQSASVWLTLGFVFAVLGAGPYLSILGETFCTAPGQPWHLPVYYLTRYSDFLGRWQQPNVVTPLVMFGFYAATLRLRPALKAKGWRLILALILVVAILAIACPTPISQSNRAAHMASINSDYVPGAYTVLPQSPAFMYPHLERLRELPAGAIIDLPLFFVPNSWHYAFYHGHPQLLSQPQMFANVVPNPQTPQMLRDNRFLLFLLERTLQDCAINAREGLDSEVSISGEALKHTYATLAPPNDTVIGRTYGNSIRLQERELDRAVWLSTLAELERLQGTLEGEPFERAIQEMYDLGFRYIVLHRSGCCWLSGTQGNKLYRRFQKDTLRPLCGEPLIDDGEAAIYMLPGGNNVQTGSRETVQE